jgi:hypothetical protein
MKNVVSHCEGFTSGSQARFTSGLQQRQNDSGLSPPLSRTFTGTGGLSSQSPMSPNGNRAHNFPPGQLQRAPSETGSSGADLGKGVPLHAVPSHWHLYIIEFKAGRTDLFYSTDSGPEIRVGDVVIVEADRGKDLGKVVNDTITLGEVEAFQKQQAAKFGYGEDQAPMSPGAPGGSGKKDINPKRIFGKAQPQDIQYVINTLSSPSGTNLNLQVAYSKDRRRRACFGSLPHESSAKEITNGSYRCRIPVVLVISKICSYTSDISTGTGVN